MLDGMRSSHPVIVPIKDAKEVEQVFDAISYCKGSSVVRMVNAITGAEAFRKGCRLTSANTATVTPRRSNYLLSGAPPPVRTSTSS